MIKSYGSVIQMLCDMLLEANNRADALEVKVASLRNAEQANTAIALLDSLRKDYLSGRSASSWVGDNLQAINECVAQQQ